MKLLRKEQSLVLWCFSASLLLSSCGGAGPECGSLDTDTRNSVVKIVSDDSNNKLVNYAVKNSSSVAAMVAGTKSEAEKLEIWEKARQGAVYRLGAVRNAVGIRCGAFSGNMKVSFQAARSIG